MTLKGLIKKKTRLITGSVKIKTGEQIFFDSGMIEIKPEHVMASGSLPPGFPGIRIDVLGRRVLIGIPDGIPNPRQN